MANSNLTGKSYKLPSSLQEKLNMESITYENLKRFKNRFETQSLTDEEFNGWGGKEMIGFVESQLGHIRRIDTQSKQLKTDYGIQGQGRDTTKSQIMPANVGLSESIERIKKLMNF
mgnify:CR=1 FL=1